MAGALNLIQLYPALGKMVSDMSAMWQGKDVSARERILQHKLDDLLTLLKEQPKRTTTRLMRDASTQTEGTVCGSPQFGTSPHHDELETPREWCGVVTGMGRVEDHAL